MAKIGLMIMLFLAGAITVLTWAIGCQPQSSGLVTAANDLSAVPADRSLPGFVLISPEVKEGGMLPREYTCDGCSSTLPLEWAGLPSETQSLALIMHTIPAPGESHWYWVLYNIPPQIHTLYKNTTGIGTLGNNSVNRRTEYAPPCSKGPGLKRYTYTLYALSTVPRLLVPPEAVSRGVLLSAIQETILGAAELNVYYAR
jgi:phosphatidylethanolamine-binding protein (PEBP) family uncharacterized protein